MALENKKTPTALILSRQPIADLPVLEGSTRYKGALMAEKGAYIVNKVEGKPDMVFVANGSEVATLFDAYNVLTKEKNMKIQVVSAISEGLFREQPKDYQEKVIPFGVPVLGMTAGLPVTLSGMVGPFGKVIGLERFGASAPFKVLDEKFGYNKENVIKQVEIYLKEFKDNINKIKSL